ncbi:MAG: CPBP family intramembrane glutamic endopeptidase [Candidatus Thorarchaeota archaeon]|jgi:membrane protease YdiL (CAAX protease family)
MTITIMQDDKETPTNETISVWSRMNLLYMSGIMLTIAVAWRIFDVFILGLGDTWFNIFPSKLFPFLIIIGVFRVYRRNELSSVLGLSKDKLRVQLSVGIIIGFAMYILIDVVSNVIFGTLIDNTYSLTFLLLFIDLLWYQFIFFFTNALLEETLFRGLMVNGFRTRFTDNQAILVSAILFAVWHIVWPLVNGSPVSEAIAMTVFSMIFGTFLGLYYIRFSGGRSLTGIIVAHTLVNFFNETFRIGPELSVQGPDLAFASPVLLGLNVLMFMVTMMILFWLVTRYKIEQVGDLVERFKKHIVSVRE